MKLFWFVVPVLVVAAASGCSDDSSSKSDSGQTNSAASGTTGPSSGDDTPGSGSRISLGETKTVLMPADAVMDIKVPAEWGDAADALRCTVTDAASGRAEDLHSSELAKKESIGGKEWTTLWTFASPPNAELTVGCADPDEKIKATETRYIRVTPRGVFPTPTAR